MADLRGLVRNLTYSEQAREVLRELIFNGTFRPGQRLKETEISRDLGISRAPSAKLSRRSRAKGSSGSYRTEGRS